MKLNRLFAVLLLIIATLGVSAQDKRTVKTKVADVLMYLPAEDNAQALRLFHQLIELGDEGITLITDQVQPNGNTAGIPYRFAVSLLTHYASTPAEKLVIEKNYIAALARSTTAEVKAYFIDNLKWVGSNAALPALAAGIADKELADQSIAAIEIIGTQEAKQALATSLATAPPFAKARLLQALGRLRYQPSLEAITKAASASELPVRRSALWSLALLGNLASSDVLLQAAKATGFKNDLSEASNALIEYLKTIHGNNPIVAKLSKAVLDGTPDASQQHYRLGALQAWAESTTAKVATAGLIRELGRFDAEYRKEVLNVARPLAGTAIGSEKWTREYTNQKGDAQADILSLLAQVNQEYYFTRHDQDPAAKKAHVSPLASANQGKDFASTLLLPALTSANPAVRRVAAQALGDSHTAAYAANLLDYLLSCTDDAELSTAKADLLELIDKDNASLLAAKLPAASAKSKVVLLQILAERRAVTSFDAVLAQTSSADATVKKAALAAVPYVSGPSAVAVLLGKLSATNDADEIAAFRNAVAAGVNAKTAQQVNDAYATDKIKLIPVLPYLNDKGALDKVTELLNKGDESERDAAFTALLKWQNSDAVRTLIRICKDEHLVNYHARALAAALAQTVKSALPDDEKLLLLREILPLAAGKQEKINTLRAFGNVRTFLSFLVVSSYIDDADLGSIAIRMTNQLALPTGDGRPGMTGAVVRETLERTKDKLKGEDSQYELIDVESYLAKMPYTRGYESIFNGKDLSGWKGLVDNPVLRSKMTAEVLAKKQKEANAAISRNWSVKDGMIVFQGDGANLCTVRPYGDFEMIVDWRISKNGDSGIYLRGSPQVQIWDIARVDVGAQVGSGGLHNNEKEKRTPLTVADNPVGEWNTFRIRMIGDKVTVYLNGILVVDNVTMENYWDRSLPIYPTEAIELQAHGTDLAFRNLYVKELGSGAPELSVEEKKEGFVSLFDGKSLSEWTGNTTEYVVEDNAIALYPAKEGHGNLNSRKQYSDFIFRFEFQLTPGANNGIGIHAPAEGDAAYAGKEIQVLDDTAPVYAALEPWQYHGSVYGIIPAKKGHLKPVGDWNKEEIYVKGDLFRVTLNGTVITEGNVKELSAKGTLDHKDHPGLLSHNGHIEFLGHGSVVRFRNIRVKEL